MSPHRESWWQRGGDNSRDQEAEPDEPECVRNDQRGNGILAAHDPEARQDVQYRDHAEGAKAQQNAEPK